MAIHIANARTDAMVRKLAAALGLGLIETIDLAVAEALEARDIAVDEPTEGPGTVADLEGAMRAAFLGLKRFKEEKTGKRSSTGYAPGMIAKHTAIGAAERLTMKGTAGLAFLIEHDGLEHAIESLVVDPRFSHLFSPDVVTKAERALREARLLIDDRNR